MAKALLGFVGSPTPTTAAEVRRLRRRVSELESLVIRLQAQNDALAAAAAHSELLTLDDERESVLA